MGLAGFTLFDAGAAIVLAGSGVFGLFRGFTREVTTVIAFVLAAVIAVFGLRFTAPIARHVIETAWMANTAAVLVAFIIAYIILRLIGGMLTRQVRDTAVLSSLDRVLGFGVGVIRGLVMLGGFALLINAATPPERQPPWIYKARLWPIADGAATVLKMFAPEGLRMANTVAPAVQDAVKQGAAAGDRGYDENERKSLDDLVEKSR
jgi:membrane protein required for colicin V production